MFGYKCDKCGKGIVRATRVNKYKTRIDGIPFTVEDAVIGTCDHCNERYFSARETKRWRDLFFREQLQKRSILTAFDISQQRKKMGLTVADFARLIGCSRQALYLWESPDREAPQSRMADLLINLVRESFASGSVDVVRFLTESLRRNGMEVPDCLISPRSGQKQEVTPVRSEPMRQQTEDIDKFHLLFPHSNAPTAFSPRLRLVA